MPVCTEQLRCVWQNCGRPGQTWGTDAGVYRPHGCSPLCCDFQGCARPSATCDFCLHTSACRRSVSWHQRGMDKACCDTLRMMITLAMGWVLLISSHDMLRVCVCVGMVGVAWMITLAMIWVLGLCSTCLDDLPLLVHSCSCFLGLCSRALLQLLVQLCGCFLCFCSKPSVTRSSSACAVQRSHVLQCYRL